MVTMLLPSGCGLMRVLASAHERDVVDAIDVGHALLGNAEAIGEVGASLSAPPCLIARTKSLQSSPLSRGSLAMVSSVKQNWSRVPAWAAAAPPSRRRKTRYATSLRGRRPAPSPRPVGGWLARPLHAIVAPQDFRLEPGKLFAGEAIEPILGPPALLPQPSQVERLRIDAEEAHQLGNVDLP